MLIPITRKKFEELIPLTATADQYRYYWGKFSDILQRVLISVTALVVVAIAAHFTDPDGKFEIIVAFFGSAAGLYWLWYPVYQATRRNLEMRGYRYSGFLQAEVLDFFVTEELVGKEETVNKQGELVIIENRERRINLEIGDETGFVTTVQAPLLRLHRSIRRGDIAELLVLANRGDLSRISAVSDVYLPEADLWISDYPYLRKDTFLEVKQRLGRLEASENRQAKPRSGSRSEKPWSESRAESWSEPRTESWSEPSWSEPEQTNPRDVASGTEPRPELGQIEISRRQTSQSRRRRPRPRRPGAI